MTRFDDADKIARTKSALDAWSKMADDMSKNVSRGGVSRQVVSTNVASLFSGVDAAKEDDRSEWTIQFDFPDFDKIRKELAEKYKLTPAEEAQNKAVELGKKWGTNPNGKKITPYTKALDANEEHARLLFDSNIDEAENPQFGLRLIPLHFGKQSIADALKSFDDKKEFKEFLKKENVDIKNDLTEQNISDILDKWPDFFDEEELQINEGEEKEVGYRPVREQIYNEFAMESSKDSIYYVKPMWNKKAEEELDKAFSLNAQDVLTKLADPPEDEPVKPAKMSWKQMQRMRKNNPMWKPN